MNKVSAVIVTYNNAVMLERLLGDLKEQTVRPDAVFVIDNSSDSKTADLIAKNFPRVDYFRSEFNLGSAGGYYQGLRIASRVSELIWLLDDDVRLRRDALEKLLIGFEKVNSERKVGAVRSWWDDRCPIDTPQETDNFAWRGTLLKREAVEEIGLPRKEYFLYADDTEYSFRMVAAGYSIFLIPGSVALESRSDDRERLELLGITARIYKDKLKLYYAFRNQLDMFIRAKMLLKSARTLLYGLKVLLLVGLTGADNRLGRISAVLKGIGDGFQGKLGRYEEN